MNILSTAVEVANPPLSPSSTCVSIFAVGAAARKVDEGPLLQASRRRDFTPKALSEGPRESRDDGTPSIIGGVARWLAWRVVAERLKTGGRSEMNTARVEGGVYEDGSCR